jgi:FKBP-type peptidyl-prolyl cis-trans isomerase (trigger factor)
MKQPALKVENNAVISATIDAAATACKVELPNNLIRKPETQALVEQIRGQLQVQGAQL